MLSLYTPLLLLAALQASVEGFVADAQEPGSEAQAAVVQTQFQGYPAQDFLSYAIDLQLDPREAGLQGQVHYHLRAVDEALHSVRLDALQSEQYQVTFAHADGTDWPASYDGRAWVLSLDSPLAAGAELKFSARLNGMPPDGIYWTQSRYGEPFVYTDHFSTRARGWLPCEDHPSERAAYQLTIRTPKATDQVACTGGLSQTVNEAGAVWTARTATDISSYMLAIAVGPYTRLKEPGDARLVDHYVYRKDKAKARRALKWHQAWMEVMEQSFGPYPYAKYTTVQVPTRWGGMENPGNVWLMESIFDGGDRGVGTLAHEFAHMWFGDAVGYSRWQDAWLSEGFASYFGPWLHEAVGDGPALRGVMQANRQRWLRTRAGRERPIRWLQYEQPDDFFGSSSVNTYSKGAWVLHMLRQELGDEVFLAALGHYFRSYAGQAVITEQLRDAVEEHSGEELDWFFQQWIDRPDCPHLRFTWSDEQLLIEQTQAADPFRFSLPVTWENAQGETVETVVQVTERETVVPIQDGPIRKPAIDPGVTLLYRRSTG